MVHRVVVNNIMSDHDMPREGNAEPQGGGLRAEALPGVPDLQPARRQAKTLDDGQQERFHNSFDGDTDSAEDANAYSE